MCAGTRLLSSDTSFLKYVGCRTRPAVVLRLLSAETDVDGRNKDRAFPRSRVLTQIALDSFHRLSRVWARSDSSLEGKKSATEWR